MSITMLCLNEKTTVKIQSKISIKTDTEDTTPDFVLKLRPGGLFSNQLPSE